MPTAGGTVSPRRVLTDRHWTVEAGGLAGFAYGVCLDAAGLRGITNPERLAVVKRAGPFEPWRPLPTTFEASGAGTFACAAHLTSFSEFALATDASAPLPVELVGFEAVRNGAAVVLSWTTASETNNAGFAVEARPAAAGAFRELAFVAGRGTTAERQTYTYEPDGLAPGRYAFRLRQVDTDGAVRYSAEVEADVEAARVLALGRPAPNPARGAATLAFTVAHAGRATLTVHDALGRRVATLFDDDATPGTPYRATLDAGSVAAGAYFVTLRSGDGVRTQPVTVVR